MDKKVIKKCLDYLINERIALLDIFYLDNEDYLDEYDIAILKSGNYDIINFNDKELSFCMAKKIMSIANGSIPQFNGLSDSEDEGYVGVSIIFENEEDYTEAEVVVQKFLFKETWIQFNRENTLNILLNEN